jgi:hypothetical protein
MSSFISPGLALSLGCLFLAAGCGEFECPRGYVKVDGACARVDAGAAAATAAEGSTTSGPTTDPDSGEMSTTGTMDSGSGATVPSADSGTATDSAATPPASDANTSPVNPDPNVGNDAAAPAPECDATRTCSPGFVCSGMKCVSACTQTQCDPNATCSLVANAPVCTCNRGFIAMSGNGVAVTCLKDVACEELGCHVNAECRAGTNQLRSCVCKNGYTGDGKTCAPVSCPMPAIENGTVSLSSGLTLDSTATYRCSSGYKQVTGGSWTRTCGTDMRWSGTDPSCTVITCASASLPAPLNGAVSTPDGREFGDRARYTCDPGYKLNGSEQRTCNEQGWSGTAPMCAATCGNGAVDAPGEECDPTASPWNAWTCSPSCVRKSAYTPCEQLGSTSNCLSGEMCGTTGCTRSCTVSSTCPSTPAGIRAAPGCAANQTCAAMSCSQTQDCAPGLVCKQAEGSPQSVCMVCTVSESPSPCPAGRRCVAVGGTSAFGFCR